MSTKIKICECLECTANAIALTHKALEDWRPSTTESKAEVEAVLGVLTEDAIAELVRACLRVAHAKTELAIAERTDGELN